MNAKESCLLSDSRNNFMLKQHTNLIVRESVHMLKDLFDT